VAAEGRYRTAAQVSDAFDAGASFVVVGGAITDPLAIAKRLVAATPLGRREIGDHG
jgi:N-acylglucosamine-6-phosphate 2-epimerase